MTEIGEKYPTSSSLIYVGRQETNLHYQRNSVPLKQQVKDEKKGSFRAPSESESESDNSQNPDDPFKDSSDLPAETESARSEEHTSELQSPA